MITITPDQSRQARRELGLSQADVAAETGFKRPYISDYENGIPQRFTATQLRKLRTFYEAKLAEAREAGEEVELTFGDDSLAAEAVSPQPAIEAVKAKRFHFPVDDAVTDETLASVLATIRANDRKVADLLTMVAEREEGFFSDGDYTEEVRQAFRDAFSLLSCNYLMVRVLGGWPEIGLSAATENILGDTVLAAIIGSARDTFEAAGLVGATKEKEAVEVEGEAVA